MKEHVDRVCREVPLYQHQREIARLVFERPSLGVFAEMGCVDRDTEYLSPTGWRPIHAYAGGEVAQWHPKTGNATFVTPNAYVVKPCDVMWHFKTKYGVDQMVSPNHRMPVYSSTKYKSRMPRVLFADQIARRYTKRAYSLPAAYTLRIDGIGMALTEAQLRVQVAVNADGSLPYHPRCHVRIKKERKKKRLRKLLNDATIAYKELPCKPEGFSVFSFTPPLFTKRYGDVFWAANSAQLEIIADECVHWDGSVCKAGALQFFTRVKEDADFICHAFAATGLVTRVMSYSRMREGHEETDYVVRARPRVNKFGNAPMLCLGHLPQTARRVLTTDGLMYSFSVPTTFLVFRRNGCVFVSGNTGKSRAVLTALAYKNAFPCLVVCPKTVVDVWVHESERWLGVTPVVVDGLPAKRMKKLEVDAPIFVVNYEMLRRHLRQHYTVVDGARRKFVANDVRRAKAWRCVVADELSRVKHPKAKQSMALHAFNDVPYRYGLTGTPITHSPLDLFSEFMFIDPNVLGRSYMEFEDRYAQIVKQRLPDGHSRRYTHFRRTVGYKNLEDLWARTAPHVVQYKKSECLDLPPKVFETRHVDLSVEQRRAYAQLVNDYVASIGDEVLTAANVLSRLVKLQEICQGFALLEDGTTHAFGDNPKLRALAELLEDVTPSEKVVVWCRFRFDVESVFRMASAAGYDPLRIDGSVTKQARTDAIGQFQSDRDRRVIVCQIDTAGFGVTLTAATVAAYYSQGFNLDMRLQSEDRIHRIGTTRKCTYVDLVCRDTVDEVICANLAGKKQLAGEFDARRFADVARGRES